jgi:hypothetical protein
MFGFTGVRRDDLKMPLGAAIGIGAASFAASGYGLTDRALWAAAMAAVAGLTVVLFLALE